MEDINLSLQDVSKSYGERHILNGITLSFLHGAKIGVIGANGSGKSSLLKILAGRDPAFDGTRIAKPGLTVGYVEQEPALDLLKDVRGNLEEGLRATRALLERYDEVSGHLSTPLPDAKMQKAMDELSTLQERIEACGGWELDHRIEIAMHALNVPPGDTDVRTLSGGERRRVALCRTLLEQPGLLLLDEPTNHLDAESVAWLETHLAAYPGTVIAVTHDRYFLDHVVGWMLEIERGRGIPYKGNYSSYLEQKQVRLEIGQGEQAARRKVLARELEWIRTTPKARNVKSKSRLANYERLLSEAQSFAVGETGIELTIPPGPRLGDRVAEVKNLSKAYGAKRLFENLSFSIPRGGIVGVIGANGTGKTTLAKILTGEIKPDAGEIVLGPTAVLAYVDQTRETLDPAKSVFMEISGGEDTLKFGTREIPSRAYLARFNFRGADQQKLVKDLSGGERNRLQLAKVLRKGANLILLDEPTNDLDLDTLRVLDEALSLFAGSIIVITHDRYFLDRIATHILAFEGDGKVRWFEGNFEMWQARREEERADTGEADAIQKARRRKFE